MKENKQKKLPEFESNQDVIDFFENNDLGEYELAETDFEVNLKRNHYLVSVDEDLMNKLLEVAKEQQVSVEMLLHSCLKEKLGEIS